LKRNGAVPLVARSTAIRVLTEVHRRTLESWTAPASTYAVFPADGRFVLHCVSEKMHQLWNARALYGFELGLYRFKVGAFFLRHSVQAPIVFWYHRSSDRLLAQRPRTPCRRM